MTVTKGTSTLPPASLPLVLKDAYKSSEYDMNFNVFSQTRDEKILQNAVKTLFPAFSMVNNARQKGGLASYLCQVTGLLF